MLLLTTENGEVMQHLTIWFSRSASILLPFVFLTLLLFRKILLLAPVIHDVITDGATFLLTIALLRCILFRLGWLKLRRMGLQEMHIYAYVEVLRN